MNDSEVWVYDGSRGSGKTLSAVYECAMRMIEGETVISNVPIEFDLEKEDGSKTHLQSKPLDIDSVVTMAEDYRNATIFWDEMSLWLYSRTSGAVINRLVTLVLTMIRKRKLSLIITTQAARFIDSNVRFQMDCLINCFDMSYLQHYTGNEKIGYHKLRRGELIRQIWKDISGIHTGTQYSEDGESYMQFFKGWYGWGLYDTNYEFDVMQAAGTKYKIKPVTKVVKQGEIVQAYFPATHQQIESILSELPSGRYRTGELETYLRTSGVEGESHVLGRQIKKAGWGKGRDSAGYYYEKVTE